jgi:hypothetical protein
MGKKFNDFPPTPLIEVFSKDTLYRYFSVVFKRENGILQHKIPSDTYGEFFPSEHTGWDEIYNGDRSYYCEIAGTEIIPADIFDNTELTGLSAFLEKTK